MKAFHPLYFESIRKVFIVVTLHKNDAVVHTLRRDVQNSIT